LLGPAIDALDVRAGGLYLDATFGAGGHSSEIVRRGGRVIAFDQDPHVVVPPHLSDRVELVRENFSQLAAALDARGIAQLDGALFDIGVSSMQFDRPERGFSLTADGPLDMRMSDAEIPTAYDLLAESSEKELADLIFNYGEERAARRIARAIVDARARNRLPTRTLEFARMISGVLHQSGKRERIHPATRTFQALRIAVNDELGALERGLDAAIAHLSAGGRIAVITFHSLEDRIVKVCFRSDARVHALTKKPLGADEEERARNPRSRSAKLRVAERVA
jgi:16S rRNA (cytosine1402-N4)-methyltransferase